jgi:hypothetical protein
MADKWESYYSKQFLPWDSGVPSSQLIAFFTTCLSEHLTSASSNNTSHSPSIHDLINQAEAAPIALPPEATACLHQQASHLHVCELCAALKPPTGGSVLELGCGTGASAVWLARQVRCSRASNTVEGLFTCVLRLADACSCSQLCKAQCALTAPCCVMH